MVKWNEERRTHQATMGHAFGLYRVEWALVMGHRLGISLRQREVDRLPSSLAGHAAR